MPKLPNTNTTVHFVNDMDFQTVSLTTVLIPSKWSCNCVTITILFCKTTNALSLYIRNETATNLNVFETFLMIGWQTCLEQYRIHPKLSKKKWVITINLCEKLDAFMSLVIVCGPLIKTCFTSWATEKYKFPKKKKPLPFRNSFFGIYSHFHLSITS